MTDANIALVARIYGAFAANDMAALIELFHPDVEMVQVGRNTLGGAFHGRNALFGHFADIPRRTEALDMAPYALLAGDGGHVAALNWMTVRQRGAERKFRVIHVFRIEDGKVVELRSIPEDPYALDVFVGGMNMRREGNGGRSRD